jgi:hypothetical protein
MQQLLVLTDAYGVQMFNALLPRIIDDAEGRIYNDPELDFLFTRTTDVSEITTPGVRSVAIPERFIVVEGVSLITPANTLPSAAGSTRVPLLRTTRAFLDLTWPNESLTLAPAPFETYYAIFSQQEPADANPEIDDPGNLPSAIKIGPTPDGQYRVEFTGTYQPAPLSATNTPTLLSMHYPELLMAAAMVFGCALLKNWSAMADDPRSAVSWEAHYQTLKTVAIGQSHRQKSQGPSWSAHGPPVLANLSRTGQPPAPAAPRG